MSNYKPVAKIPKSLASSFFLVTTPLPAVQTSFRSI